MKKGAVQDRAPHCRITAFRLKAEDTTSTADPCAELPAAVSFLAAETPDLNDRLRLLPSARAVGTARPSDRSLRPSCGPLPLPAASPHGRSWQCPDRPDRVCLPAATASRSSTRLWCCSTTLRSCRRRSFMAAVLFVPLGERRRHVHLLDDVAPADARVIGAERDFPFLRRVRDDAPLGAAEVVVERSWNHMPAIKRKFQRSARRISMSSLGPVAGDLP